MSHLCMRILGFDVSSACIAYCLLQLHNDSITLTTIHYFKPLKKGTIFERLESTRDKVRQILEKETPDAIAIEDIVSYMPGKSNANTIITLALFNRAVGSEAYRYLGKPPSMWSVMAIRHAVKLDKALPSKEDMPSIIERRLGIAFPYRTNRKKNIAVESYDMADAASVALCHIIKTQKTP